MSVNSEAKSKCDMVVDRILSMIVNRQYPIGSRLPAENEFCKQFGVSRITIRESFKRLEVMGVVSIQQGKGTFVKEIGLGTFMQPMFNLIDFGLFDISTIYDARQYIETGSCRLAAQNRNEEEIEKLSLMIDQMEEALKHKEFDRLSLVDSEFHIEIANISKNQILKAAVINLENISTACAIKNNKSHAVMVNAQTHHRALVKAIKDGDADEAQRIIVKHTIESKKCLI